MKTTKEMKVIQTGTFLTDLPPSAQIISSQRTVTSVKRTVDEMGNVVSEETETRTLEGNEDLDAFVEKSFTDISPNVQVVSTQKKVTSIRKTLDEFGNVISEDIQTLPSDEVTTADLSSNVQLLSTERKVTSVRKVLDEDGNVVSEETRTLEGNKDFDEFTAKSLVDLPANAQIVSTQKKVTSVKKIVDEFGNVISEDIQTTTLPGEETSSSFKSVPNT